MRGRYPLVPGLAVMALASGCADFAGIGDPKPVAPDAPPTPCLLGGIDLCLYAFPQSALVIGTDLVINTDRDCDVVYNNPIGRSSCVLYARTIEVNAKLTARGTRPLILAATESLEVNGTIDVSRQFGVSGVPAAAEDRDCAMVPPSSASAGGSFGGRGGDGGSATDGAVALAAPAVTLPDYLRGGCGAAGGPDLGGASGGAPSGGGGAVGLVSGGVVTIGKAGKVTANGAGGRRGVDGDTYAGGGGSGGMIRIGAPRVVIEGIAVANGGGGGEGVDGTTAGNPGADGTLTVMRAAGGSGHPGGGDGGGGGAGTTPDGQPGQPGIGVSAYADGGGGGGAGFVVIIGPEVAMTGTVSPQPIRLP